MIAIREIVVAAVVIGMPSAVVGSPISFSFGVPSSITVVANQDVFIPAALVNTGTDPLVFVCPCNGSRFTWGLEAVLPEEGLNALAPQFLDPQGRHVLEQFEPGLTLAPGGRFDFFLAKINFDPSIEAGNPAGTVLHPTFFFQFGPSDVASVQSIVSVGPRVEFGPLSFATVPEADTLLLMFSGLVSLAGMGRRFTLGA